MDITINQAKAIVRSFCERTFSATSENAINTPLLLHSSPGIGKSAIIRQVANELTKKLGEKIEIRDVRLASLEPSDVNGIPFVSREGGDKELMKFSTPSWFPTDPDSHGILFFDEISNAIISTQHAAYRVILDRQINNGTYLPHGWQIIAAGNLKSDKTGAKNVVPALANRFATHLYIKPNMEDFLMYAFNHGIHPHVTGFIGFSPNMLHMMPKDDSEAAYPTPRTWEYVSNHLHLNLDEAELIPVISGCVGDKTAMQFSAFRKYFGKLPDFEKIMTGQMQYKVPKEDLGIVWAVTSSLIECSLKNHADSKRMKNLGKVLFQLDDDFIVLFFKSIKQGKNNVVANIIPNLSDSFDKVIKYIK